MSDLRQRFRTLDYLPDLDVWGDVEARAAVVPARPASAMLRFAPLVVAAAAVVVAILIGVGLMSRSPDVGPPSTPEPAASESAVPRASMRPFVREDLAALQVQDGDLAGGSVSEGVAPLAEPSTVAWTEHLEDHGLQGRRWTYLSSDEEESPLGYGYIGGAGVSLWADAESAVEALAFENSTPREGISILRSLEAPELGDEGWCGVLDFPPNLENRAWCRFAVSNVTFDLYIRTGDQLDPRATGDLADLALLLRRRAESLAAGMGNS
jgi:hypothetical protein